MVKKVFLATILAVLIVFLFVEFSPKTTSSKDLREELRNSLQEKRGRDAFDKLKKEYLDENYSLQHSAAHIFGEELFDAHGVVGIEVCDEAFGFGCFHGFFSRAVSGNGIEIARSLDEVCVEKFGLEGLGCPHGIGHGLGEYFGPENLSQQLSVCGSLAWQGELFGCQQGVFMEFNFPTEFGSDGATPKVREVNEEDLFFPCGGVETKFKKACFFELPYWWDQVFSHDYEIIGEYCGELTADLAPYCFKGAGAASLEIGGFAVERSVSDCKSMPDAVSTTLCLSGASWMLFSNPETRVKSETICDSDGVDKRLCILESKLI